MVTKSGGYFGRPFKGYQGVTQGDTPSPTIFNVVVDAVIHHWVTVVTPSEAGMGGLGLTIIDLEAYFYAENIIVAPNQPERIQRAFDVLTGLLDRVSLRKKTAKTVGMVCQPCCMPGGGVGGGLFATHTHPLAGQILLTIFQLKEYRYIYVSGVACCRVIRGRTNFTCL